LAAFSPYNWVHSGASPRVTNSWHGRRNGAWETIEEYLGGGTHKEGRGGSLRTQNGYCEYLLKCDLTAPGCHTIIWLTGGTPMTQFHLRIILACGIGGLLIPNAHADAVATYTFNGTLNAVQPGVAPLTAVDSLGTSGFQTATVFGNSQTTYHFDGAANPVSDQGGLDFNTTGLISSNDYSVEMVFELDDQDGWRRVLDSLDRQSDYGLYIDPNNNLDLYPNGGAGSPFTSDAFFDLFVTVDPSGTVNGYFGGVEQFSEISPNLDVSTNTLGFFLDNVVGGGQGEWSSGNVALIKVFNTALTADQVAAETADPFQGTSTAPEPGTWMLMVAGAAGVAVLKRRRAITNR